MVVTGKGLKICAGWQQRLSSETNTDVLLSSPSLTFFNFFSYQFALPLSARFEDIGKIRAKPIKTQMTPLTLILTPNLNPILTPTLQPNLDPETCL